MKLLLDQNLSFKLCVRLEDLYPGSTQARSHFSARLTSIATR
jgi:hypothetical protein